MIRSYGFLVVAVVACASAGPAGAPAPKVINDEREANLSAALGQRVTTDDMRVSESLDALRADAYRALIAAFAKLGLPAELTNPSSGLVAVAEKRVSGTLAGEPLSRFLSCGETMTGARANQDRIMLSVVSYAKPVGSTASRLETRVVATAIDVTGTGGRQPCTTTGELETRLHRMVKAAVGS